MSRRTDHTDEIARLTEELQRVRRLSLTASRNGDFRAVGRLTAEAARLNTAILQAEGLRVPGLDTIQDKFFTGASLEERTAIRQDPSVLA